MNGRLGVLRGLGVVVSAGTVHLFRLIDGSYAATTLRVSTDAVVHQDSYAGDHWGAWAVHEQKGTDNAGVYG